MDGQKQSGVRKFVLTAEVNCATTFDVDYIGVSGMVHGEATVNKVTDEKAVEIKTAYQHPPEQYVVYGIHEYLLYNETHRGKTQDLQH